MQIFTLFLLYRYTTYIRYIILFVVCWRGYKILDFCEIYLTDLSLRIPIKIIIVFYFTDISSKNHMDKENILNKSK